MSIKYRLQNPLFLLAKHRHGASLFTVNPRIRPITVAFFDAHPLGYMWRTYSRLKLASSVCCTSHRPRAGIFRHIQSITYNDYPIFNKCHHPYQIYHTYSHMWITPVSTLKCSHENLNMQIRLKLCQILRVEKFHTWKFQAWNLHT